MKIRKHKNTFRALMPHQKEALNYCLNKDHPALFMEMRLGKTLVTIRWAKKLNLSLILVVAPLTVIEAWQNELLLEKETYVTCCGQLKHVKMQLINEAQKNSNYDRTWVLINYESISRIGMYLDRIKWDSVILDESTRIKNITASVTRNCIRYFRNVPHRVILTGLPSPEGLLDLCTQFIFLHGQFLGCTNYYQFTTKYFRPDDGTHRVTSRGKVPMPGAANAIKNAVHKLAFIKRKSDVGLGGKKIYMQKNIAPTAEQIKAIKQLKNDFEITVNNSETLQTKYIITQILWLCRVAGGFTPDLQLISKNKFKVLLEILTEELPIQDQVVVWFKFREELKYAYKLLKENNISSDYIHGGVPQSSRESILRNFRNKNIKVLLCTVQCAKFGIDCSSASTAIYYSHDWSCEARLQSEERIVHPHKKEPNLYIDLITRGSIDSRVLNCAKNKSISAKMFMQEVVEWLNL